MKICEGICLNLYFDCCPLDHHIIVLSQMAEVAQCCLSEDAVDRPEMREIVVSLSKLVTYSKEWEASLGRNSQVFSGLFRKMK